MRAVRRRLDVAGRERGSALVSAVAVAIVGVMLVTVVVSSVIAAAKDSGTDRARTSEVHSAEGAVDAGYAALEVGTPCRLPATGSYSSGTAPKTTQVYATIAYFSAAGVELPCASDTVTGTAASAVITAVAATSGETVKRTIQSKVNLTPLVVDGHGAAIFSATGVTPTNDFALRSLDPDDTADLWVDDGDYSCSSNAAVDGNVIVVNGSMTLDNQCKVLGDAFTSGNFTVNSAVSWTRVGGDVIARGNAKIAGGSTFGRNVLIHGSLNTWGSSIVTGGVFRTGVSLTELPSYTRVKLPEALYAPSDFTGFANSGDRRAAYVAWVNSVAASLPGESWRPTLDPTDKQCTLSSESYSLNGPLTSPSVSSVFDLRDCATVTFGPNLTLKLRADLVLYVTNFTGTNNLTVESADGQPHRLWIISPDPDNARNGTAVCGTSGGQKSGEIKLAADSYFRQPVSTFFYTPCKATISNQVEMYGQIYGKNVVLQNGLKVAYVPMGIPGVDLTNATPVTTNIARVDIVYKREIKSS